MRPWELEDGITPSCAPLTWGSLECRRFRGFLRLTPQVRGYRVSSSVCVACGANRGGGSKTRRGLLPPRRQVVAAVSRRLGVIRYGLGGVPFAGDASPIGVVAV